MHSGLGIGSPFTSMQQQPFGLSPFGAQGGWGYQQTGLPFGQQTLQPYGPQQTITQWLQIVPHQLQQLQQLSYIQQQLLQQLVQIVPAQIQQLQQVLQYIPQQIQQLQQVIQYIPQQLQHLQQLAAQQQFGGSQGLMSSIGQLSQPQGQGFGVPFQVGSPFGSPFAGSTGHVM